MYKTIFCKYYEACGGCTMQHLEAGAYEQKKKDILLRTLTQLKLSDTILQPLVKIGKRSRRRVALKCAVNKGMVSVGFYAEKTHHVVNIDDCPVTKQAITACIPHFRTLLTSLKKPGNITGISVALVDEGLDVSLLCKQALTASDTQKWLDFCHQHPHGKTILRLCQNYDKQIFEIIKNGPVFVHFSDVLLNLPLNPFLQATTKGQEAITDLVLTHAAPYQKVADLYSGCGTYSFPLVQKGHAVAAFEGNHDMAISAHNAIKNNHLDARISFTTRDLYKNPLTVEELHEFGAVIINPPRNGASPQVKMISKSLVQCVIMVSCNPVTFQRDAALLLERHYRLESVTPIDQFYQTSHLELVAVFNKKTDIVAKDRQQN